MILFYSCADRNYSDFAALFCLSAIMNCPDSKAEVAVEYIDEAAVMVASLFPDKCTIGLTKFTGNVDAPIGRMVRQPKLKAKYVYISDIDIIHLDRGIVQTHLENMAKTGLPYSNSLRTDTPNKRMSGLHFSEYDAYYPIQLPDPLPTTDETVLYEIIKNKFGEPEGEWFRPVHGIHVSQNRTPLGVPGWGMENYYERWKEFANTKEFKEVYPLFSDRIKNIINTINEVYDSRAVN